MKVREFIALMSKIENAHLLDCEMEYEVPRWHNGGEIAPICHVSVAEVSNPTDDYYDTIVTLSNIYLHEGIEEFNHMTTKRTNLTGKPMED